MTISITNLISLLFLIQFVTSAGFNFFPNLPAGEYKVYYKAILQCEPRVTRGLQFNWFISKRSANTTEVKGNLTFDVPFDDSYDITANFAVKDLIGGWKDNAHIIKIPYACQSYKNFMGGSWIPMLKSFGIKNYGCPILPGQYVITSGLDPTIFTDQRTVWPKIFFYGSYKVKITILKNSQLIGCYIPVVDIMRLWETQ